MVLSICRQLVILLPVAWLLAAITQSVYVVWWCFPIAEIVSLFICLYMYRKCNREMIAPLPD
jgi:Na+-driven multidrug efflux pump